MIAVMVIFIFILGLSIGSFLNVLIDRLPQEESIMGRSHCDFCHKKLAWYDLFPLISFFILGGRCRYCHKKLSFFYPSLELLTGVIFLLIFVSSQNLFIGGSLDALSVSGLLGMTIKLFLASSLIVIFFADVKYQLIPDSTQLLFFLSASSLKLLMSSTTILQQIQNDALAAIVIMLPILILFLITRGRGMGFGDVKYAFSMGWLLGIEGGLIALYVAFILGAVIGLLLIVAKKKKLKSRIAFGPFLVFATILVFVYQDIFFSWIRRIYGL